jgi:vancomycin permeability regulator SanA
LKLKRVVTRLFQSGVIGTVLLVLPSLFMAARYPQSQPAATQTRVADVALILGAGLNPDGTAGPVLAARVDAGVALYNAKAVRKLVMSGDNSIALYDEVSAMKTLAVAQGVKSDDVLLDYAGFRTLDSCVRIRKVFGQTAVVLVSQSFHLARARFLCADAGVRTYTYQAVDPRSRSFILQSQVRELFAKWQAVIDAKLTNKQPKFLGPAIDINHPSADVLEQPLK